MDDFREDDRQEQDFFLFGKVVFDKLEGSGGQFLIVGRLGFGHAGHLALVDGYGEGYRAFFIQFGEQPFGAGAVQAAVIAQGADDLAVDQDLGFVVFDPIAVLVGGGTRVQEAVFPQEFFEAVGDNRFFENGGIDALNGLSESFFGRFFNLAQGKELEFGFIDLHQIAGPGIHIGFHFGQFCPHSFLTGGCMLHNGEYQPKHAKRDQQCQSCQKSHAAVFTMSCKDKT